MASLFDGLPAEDPSHQHGFSINRVDSRSEARDPDIVAAAIDDPAARVYIVQDDKAVLRENAPGPHFTTDDARALGASDDGLILLGWTETEPVLGAEVGEDFVPEDHGLTATSLRTIAVEGQMAEMHLGAFAQARSLCFWNRRHRFCGVCGAESEVQGGGYRRVCPSCGALHFPRTDPVVIMLAIDEQGGQDRCLLARQPRFAPGMYSCLAGFLEPGETIEDAVRRETKEESGITIGRVRYHSSQPWPFPASLMIGCHAEALNQTIVRDETELEDARWFDRAEVETIMADTHPGGIKCPPSIAIAHSLIKAWLEAG